MRNLKNFSLFSIFLSVTQCFQDPGKELMTCVDGGNDLNGCVEQMIENFRATMETGIPELQVPPLDPIHLNLIDFKFLNLTVEFFDLDLFGFKGFSLKSSSVDKKKRTWDIRLLLPKINAVGMYRLFGTIPPNLDLGTSTGAERFSADSVEAIAKLKLGSNGNKIKVTELDLSIELDDINLELECLFPRNGACCPKKYLKSCNAVLAKTVLRFINRDGKNFVKEFQPQISAKVGVILKDYFNKAIGSTEASYLIE